MIKAVLIDLNGTLHVGHNPIPGCISALEKLRKVPNLSIRFVTNNSKESKSALITRLENLSENGKKINIRESEIFSALNATSSLLKNRKPFYFLTEDALKDMPTQHFLEKEADTVVIGLHTSGFNYDNLNSAFRILKNSKDPKMICCNLGRYHKTSDGNSLGPGAFAKGLEFSTGIEPIVVWKPNPLFFQTPLKELGLNAEQAVMIGDDAMDDVNGAVKAGLKGILVKTGKYVDGDEEICKETMLSCVNDFGSAVDFLIENKLV